MKIEGKHRFQASQEQIWDLFMDQRHLEKALPGCEKMEEREPGKFEVLLKIGIAAVKGTYRGKMEVVDPDPPKRYRLIGEGSGSPGFVKGEAVIELSQEDQDTIVSYQGEMQVGGLIAGIGQRMIGGIAKMMVGQFFKKMEKELKSQQ
jgi:carbon monoxide dehydrogenase subunit G